MLTLEPVTPDNYDDALGLRIRPDQQRFVAPVVKSLADAYVYQGAIARVARLDNAAIGFLLLYPFEKDGQPSVNIVRLLIDEAYQGKGWGRKLLEVALDLAGTLTPSPQRIRISTAPDNTVALALYRSAGFEEAGLEEGEVALWRDA